MKATQSTFWVLRSPRQANALKLYGVQNSKPTANPGGSENSSSWHHGDQTCNSAFNNCPHNTTESKRAVKQLIRCLKGTKHTCLRLERAKWFKQVCWNLLVVVTRIGRALRQHAKCYGISLRCTERDKVKPKSETGSDQSQFMRSGLPRSQCLHQRIVGTRRTLQELDHKVSDRLEMDSDSARHSAEDQVHSNTGYERNVYPWSSGHEEQHSRSFHETH